MYVAASERMLWPDAAFASQGLVTFAAAKACCSPPPRRLTKLFRHFRPILPVPIVLRERDAEYFPAISRGSDAPPTDSRCAKKLFWRAADFSFGSIAGWIFVRGYALLSGRQSVEGMYMTDEQPAPAADLISFGPFRLCPTRRNLEKAGSPIHLNARAFDILIVLVERAGEVVSNKMLMARV
jgi:hypothetical protein